MSRLPYTYTDPTGADLIIAADPLHRPTLAIETSVASAYDYVYLPTDPNEVVELVSALLSATQAPFVLTDKEPK